MDTILNYVENMFKSLPKTKEMRNLKAEILGNMEDKYNELKLDGKSQNEAIGIVISEFGNIDELIREFEINLEDTKGDDEILTLDMDTVKEYLVKKKKLNFFASVGVVLCMIGVSILVLLVQLIEDGIILNGLAQDKAIFVPVIILLIFVVVAVALFIFSGISMDKYKYIDKGEFKLSATSKIYLRDEISTMQRRKTIGTVVGVSLCILSPIILFVGGMFSEGGYVYGTSLLILVVAIAVYILINIAASDEGHKKLLKLGEYSVDARKGNLVIGRVAGVVWPLATGIFLIWGFIYDGWGVCWLVYPVTGIIFGIFCSIYKSIKGIEE